MGPFRNEYTVQPAEKYLSRVSTVFHLNFVRVCYWTIHYSPICFIWYSMHINIYIVFDISNKVIPTSCVLFFACCYTLFHINHQNVKKLTLPSSNLRPFLKLNQQHEVYNPWTIRRNWCRTQWLDGLIYFLQTTRNVLRLIRVFTSVFLFMYDASCRFDILPHPQQTKKGKSGSIA